MKRFFPYIPHLFLAGICILMWTLLSLPDGQLHVHFLNVGQGDSIFIRTPWGRTILIDGGEGSVVLDELGEVLPFYQRSIDLLVLTHPDRDHVEGLIDVLDRHEVKEVLLTGVVHHSSFYDAFLKRVQGKRIHFAERRNDFDFGDGVVLDLLFPFESTVGETPDDSVNESSLVAMLRYGETSLLLTGDIGTEVELELVKSGAALDADVLKVGHHGSDSSSSSRFLAAVTPRWAVIQSGLHNRFNHPKPAVLDRLVQQGVTQILRNDERGRIEMISDGREFWVVE